MKKNKYTILPPVTENDLRQNNGEIDQEKLLDSPYQAFKTTIQQMKKFAIGQSYWFVVDVGKWSTVACGGAVEQMLGLTESEMLKSAQILFDKTHPEDLTKMFTFSNYWTNYYRQLPPERKAHAKATIFIRVLNSMDVYNWLMVQYADQIFDSQGNLLYMLTLVTNVQHIKKDNIATMSILNTYDESCQQFICVDGESLPNTSASTVSISNRETEVLRLMALGNSSKQIASILKLSQKTVDNHRQNMLQKTGTKSSGELVAYGINLGYI